jgi:tetratricopeptide (TPR) repeat protein
MIESTSRPKGRREPAPTTPDPIEIAMELEAAGEPAVGVARRVLERQERVLRWEAADKRAGFILKVLTGLVGLVVVGALAAMAWDASQSHALVIEAFSVPPDLAQRGMTGQVVAARVLDRMTEIQAGTDSQRAPSSFARNWDGEIKVEIPQTGITLSELSRELRAALGHDTRINGDVVRTSSGLALTVRAGLQPGATFAGPESDLDALIRQGGAAAFERTEPYRYAVYLRGLGDNPGANRVFRKLAARGSARERAWGTLGLGNNAKDDVGSDAALSIMREAERLAPWLALPPQNVAYYEMEMGHPGAARAGLDRAERNANGRGEVRPELLEAFRLRVRGARQLLDGDYAASERSWVKAMTFGPQGANQSLTARLAFARVGQHRIGAAAAAVAAPDPTQNFSTGTREMDVIVARVEIANAREDWAGAIAAAGAVDEMLRRHPGLKDHKRTQLDPLVACALARSGDMAAAEALIASTPLGSYDAVVMRGRIAALAGDARTADHWFGEAVRMGPSEPFAESAWAEALLARGDPSGASAKADAAHRKAPRFADPLELAGEALAATGDLKGAAGKYGEAASLAPSWGRLRLKWAEALARENRRDAAVEQRNLAARLELTRAERNELAALRL